MVPQRILDQLARLRGREKALRFAWGASRTLALGAGAMFLACLVDWLVDLRAETPAGLRAVMLATQGVLWCGALAMLVIRPLRERLSDREMTLWVEEKYPEFGHRLITAVELNRPGAPLEGMSPELLAAVTNQAEERTERTDFTSRMDASRLKRAASIVAAIAAVASICAFAAPRTTAALLARQFLSHREIPRTVKIQPEMAQQVRPSGEEVKLRFRAKGDVAFESLAGSVRIEPKPKDRPSEEYPLVFESKDAKGVAIFAATIPPASVNFACRAWLRDGRTRRESFVDYEPRPVVQKIDAWVLLPAYCGLRPDGSPYEQYRVRGEIAGPLGSSARVAIEVQKPVVKGVIELLGRGSAESGPETLLRQINLALKNGGRGAEGVFDLRAGETSYRILLEDRNGFANSTPPKRGIAIVPEEPPKVVLLAERFADAADLRITDDTEVEGMPIPIGKAVRIAYYCAHPYGLDRARLAYRVIKAGRIAEEGGAAASDVPWRHLPLGEMRKTAESGDFDLLHGRFEHTGFFDQVEFYPIPSLDPKHLHGRVEGGGRFDFQTKPLAGIQVGDQIELCVEVFARNPALGNLPGRSEVRVKAFVTEAQWREWVSQMVKHRDRIELLKSRQRSVFTPEGDR